MNPNRWQNQGFGFGLTTLLFLLILGAIAPDWLVNGALILFLAAILLPILGVFGLRWWLQRNLASANCPVCNYPIQGVQGLQTQCPSCGEQLVMNNRKGYDRVAPPGTVDVQAIEVTPEVEVLPPEDDR
jgi:predicted RNA-binding Zn-ribbon protein involved in translation (DUF1610 family)